MFSNLFLPEFFNTFNYLSDRKTLSYNLIKTSDDNLKLQIAIPGYSKDEIEIYSQENFLHIKTKNIEQKKEDYLYHGIFKHNFHEKWRIAKNIEIGEAKYNNGLLEIDFKLIVPEESKPKLIDIH